MAAGVYRFATTKSPVELGAETMKLKANRMLNSVGEWLPGEGGGGSVVVAGLLWEQHQGLGCGIVVDKLYRLSRGQQQGCCWWLGRVWQCGPRNRYVCQGGS